MSEAYVRPCYQSIEKPFVIEGRFSHCGGTDKWIIARVSEDDAKLLIESGLDWAHGSGPDWAEHYKKIAIMEAERDKANAEKRLAELAK